jgi:ATP-dependent Clp protease ATP-binding subunit ClpB
MNVVQEHFRPEFLNRVDDIILFRPLEEAQLVRIVDLRLADLRKMLADRKISIEVTQSAKELIFKEGYDRAYGARPLKRAIQRLVQDPMAMKILDGEILHGDHVVIDADSRKRRLEFHVERAGTSERSTPLETVESPS